MFAKIPSLENDLARKMPPFELAHSTLRRLFEMNKSRVARAKQPVFATGLVGFGGLDGGHADGRGGDGPKMAEGAALFRPTLLPIKALTLAGVVL